MALKAIRIVQEAFQNFRRESLAHTLVDLEDEIIQKIEAECIEQPDPAELVPSVEAGIPLAHNISGARIVRLPRRTYYVGCPVCTQHTLIYIDGEGDITTEARRWIEEGHPCGREDGVD